MTAKEKPLKDCFKCCVCFNVAGFVPNWAQYPHGAADRSSFTVPLLCKRCAKAFETWRGKETRSTLDIIFWVSKRAREAEHRRMADKVNELELKLRIEIAETNALIRKYGSAEKGK